METATRDHVRGYYAPSGNEYDRDGRLMNGFDYTRQAWAEAGHWVRCGHPVEMGCRCWGRVHEGEETPKPGEMGRTWTKEENKRNWAALGITS